MEDIRSKLQKNRELLVQLERKRENLDLQIENLRLRIKNQEKALLTQKVRPIESK